MQYAYDFLLNFQSLPYEIYDWDLDDPFIHIHRMPMLKVDKKTFIDLRDNEVIPSNNFLETIKNQTQSFNARASIRLDYSFLIFYRYGEENFSFLALNYDFKLKAMKKSQLTLFDEKDLTDVCKTFKDAQIIEYEILRKNALHEFQTRQDVKIYNYIISSLDSIDDDRLTYLYFECFNEKVNDCNFIKQKLKSEINNNWDNISDKLYDCLKSIYHN